MAVLVGFDYKLLTGKQNKENSNTLAKCQMRPVIPAKAGIQLKKASDAGGKVSAYKVQRRNRPEGLWQDVAMAIETEATLVDQPKKTELESRRRRTSIAL